MNFKTDHLNGVSLSRFNQYDHSGTMFIYILARRKYIRAYRRAGIINEENAAALKDLGLQPSRCFEKMVKRQMMVSCGLNRYYLNLPILEMYRDTRNHFMRIIIIIVVLFILAVVIARLTR
jgi:hypothetical protein